MPKTHFTDLTVRSLPQGLHFDERTPGFAIRIGKHRRTWLVVKEPNRTKVRLGHYPDMPLQTARRRALVALGTSHTRNTAPTFADALEAYLAQDRWRPATRHQMEWSIRRYFRLTKTLDKVTHADIADVLDGIASKSERSHAFAYIRGFFNWCVPRYLANSPCTGLKVPNGISRSRVLTDYELRAVWKAAERCDTFGTIVKLLILTGQRRGEIAALQSSWIKDDTITIPADVAKNGREHTLPLSSSCAALLEGILYKRRPANGYLFSARPPSIGPFNGWSNSKARLDKLSRRDRLDSPRPPANFRD